MVPNMVPFLTFAANETEILFQDFHYTKEAMGDGINRIQLLSDQDSRRDNPAHKEYFPKS